jgi:hypothetical protein
MVSRKKLRWTNSANMVGIWLLDKHQTAILARAHENTTSSPCNYVLIDRSLTAYRRTTGVGAPKVGAVVVPRA